MRKLRFRKCQYDEQNGSDRKNIMLFRAMNIISHHLTCQSISLRKVSKLGSNLAAAATTAAAAARWPEFHVDDRNVDDPDAGGMIAELGLPHAFRDR